MQDYDSQTSVESQTDSDAESLSENDFQESQLDTEKSSSSCKSPLGVKRHLFCLDDDNPTKKKKTAITIRNTHTLSPLNLSRLYNLIDEIYKPKNEEQINLQDEITKVLNHQDVKRATKSKHLSEVFFIIVSKHVRPFLYRCTGLKITFLQHLVLLCNYLF